MPLNKVYNSQPSAIASYDYTDIAAGVGIQNFYALVGKDNSGFTYVLTPYTYSSWLIETTLTSSPITLTFESQEFNTPKIIKGTAYFSGNGKGLAGSSTISVKLQLNRGGNITDITSAIVSGAIGTEDKSVYLELPCTQTQIKKGDKIRIVVVATTSSTPNFYVGHSPTNQTSPTAAMTNTQMIIGVPFDLNL